MSTAAVIPASPHSWLAEARAMLALSWPMVLTNVAQTAMTATDVVMMGHLGPQALAAGALGGNLYTAFLIFGIGVMSAVSPMIAIELDATAMRYAICAGLCGRASGRRRPWRGRCG